MKRKYIMLLSMLTFQDLKKSDYWRHFTDTVVLLATPLMISRVLVHLVANILSISSLMLNQFFIIDEGVTPRLLWMGLRGVPEDRRPTKMLPGPSLGPLSGTDVGVHDS